MQGNSPLAKPAGCYHLYMSQPCIKCGVEYPLDAEHFHQHKGKELSGVCKQCHKADRKRDAEKAKAKRRASLKKIEEAGIDLYAKLAQAGGSNIPHSAELVEKVCEYFGGVSGFAAIMVKQYYDSPAGSSTRNKMLETVCRLVQSNVDSGGAKKPLSLWTEEELESELQDRFRKAILSQRLVIDAQETPEDSDAPEDSENPLDDPASGGQDQGTPIGIEGETGRSPESLHPDAPAGEDSSVPVE